MAPVSFLSGSQGVQFSLYMENHPRYRLRMIAIGSVVIGLFLNILAIAISHQYILQGLAFVPLCISLIWHNVDLTSPRFRKQGLPVALLAFVDALGFCSFLALLIANGIIAHKLHRSWWNSNGWVILMTYDSVPWMICCAIHGCIAIHNIFQLLTASENALLICSECSCRWKGKHTEPREATNQAHYSLLGQKDDHEYDPEADAEKDSNAGKEDIQAPPASN